MRPPRFTHTCSWSWSYLLRFHNENTLFLGEQVCGRFWTPTWLSSHFPRELHLSDLVWLRLFLSPPQGCVVCSWSRETSVILTEPWQMPHSNKQHPFKHIEQQQLCHCHLGFRYHTLISPFCGLPFVLLGTPSCTFLPAHAPILPVQNQWDLCALWYPVDLSKRVWAYEMWRRVSLQNCRL